MIRFSPNCIVRVYSKSSTYVSGSGYTTTWADEGLLHGEWRGAFGDRATAAQALGVNDSATVRAFFNPAIYQKLRTAQCVVIKNDDNTAIKDGVPDKDNPNCYELWSGVDNYMEVSQFMEFRVRRYEGK